VKRIVLIGDPKQLNATVLHPTLKEIGYGNSFMKNVMECRQNVAHLLGIQYRCDPAIMRFSNQFYYENALITAKSACNRKPKVVHPLLFINTGSVNSDQGNEDSFGSSWRSKCTFRFQNVVLFNHLIMRC
jgi:superfamily I DNA and/or RNA helicase